jgi:hypothetical protein
MVRGNLLGLFQVSNSSSNPQDPIIGPGGKPQFVDSCFKQSVGIPVNRTMSFYLAVVHLGIAVNLGPFQPL